jgi:hypothetical protein
MEGCKSVQDLSARARDRFFPNTAPDWEEDADVTEEGSKRKRRRSSEKKQREPLPKGAVRQLEAHIQRALELIEAKWPPTTRAIEYLHFCPTFLCTRPILTMHREASVYTGAAGVALLYLHLHTLDPSSGASSGTSFRATGCYRPLTKPRRSQQAPGRCPTVHKDCAEAHPIAP